MTSLLEVFRFLSCSTQEPALIDYVLPAKAWLLLLSFPKFSDKAMHQGLIIFFYEIAGRDIQLKNE